MIVAKGLLIRRQVSNPNPLDYHDWSTFGGGGGGQNQDENTGFPAPIWQYKGMDVPVSGDPLFL